MFHPETRSFSFTGSFEVAMIVHGLTMCCMADVSSVNISGISSFYGHCSVARLRAAALIRANDWLNGRACASSSVPFRKRRQTGLSFWRGVMNKLFLPSHHLSEPCHIRTAVSVICRSFSGTDQCLNGFFPWKRTEGAPTVARARPAALWLSHCSVTVSLFRHLTCISFALCISGVPCSSPPSPPSPSLLLSLILPDKRCYFLLFRFMYFCISCMVLNTCSLQSGGILFRFKQEIPLRIRNLCFELEPSCNWIPRDMSSR